MPRGSSCSPSSSPTSRCRAPSATRVRRPRSTSPLVGRGPLRRTTCASLLAHRTRASGLRMAAAMDHVVEAPERHWRRRSRAREDVGALHGRRRRSAPGEHAADRQAARLRLVAPALAAGACATRSTPRSPQARPHRLGRAARRRSASTSTTSGTRADVEIEGDTELQQAVRFALFHIAAGRRARRAARDPREGTDRPRLRRPHFLGHRGVRAAGADLHAPRGGRATRCAGATARSTSPASARAQLGLGGSGVPVADDPRRRSARATGPRARPPSTSTRDIADAVARYQAATDDEEFERDAGLELLVETARLWRSLGHHDARGQLPHRRRHRARTSTARSPTTTSTRT